MRKFWEKKVSSLSLAVKQSSLTFIDPGILLEASTVANYHNSKYRYSKVKGGSDVLKGLAFGASLVGLGRPILYGLAAEGRDGVHHLITEITAEMKRIMSLIGAEDPAKLTRDMLIEDP